MITDNKIAELRKMLSDWQVADHNDVLASIPFAQQVGIVLPELLDEIERQRNELALWEDLAGRRADNILAQGKRIAELEAALRKIEDGCGWPVCDAVRDIARTALNKEPAK